ncbi:MAG: hypothetical protein OHK0013_17360 [Sandaracinaceae bacterium]
MLAARTFAIVLVSWSAAGCCLGGSAAAPEPALAAAPAAPVVAPTVTGVPYTIVGQLPEWNSSYSARNLNDGTSSYWSTGASPTFPLSATLALGAPTGLVAIDLDTRVENYETSAISDVTIELLDAQGTVVSTQRVGLHQNAVTSVPVSSGPVSSVRLTMNRNFGGTYAALTEVTLRTTPGAGQPPLPVQSRGLAYTIDPSIPTWSSSYAASLMQDGNSGTYWCSPSGTAFPFSFVLTFPAVATVTSLRFDTRLPNYETSALREITLEALGPAGQVLSTSNQTLALNSETVVTLPAPMMMNAIRITARSNHGGPYVGLSELVIEGTGLPAL